MVDACRRVSDAEIVLGGPAVSQSPREVARYLGCRFAVTGEGERSFPEFLRAVEHGSDPFDVCGVVTTDADEASPRTSDMVTHLSALPDPATPCLRPSAFDRTTHGII